MVMLIAVCLTLAIMLLVNAVICTIHFLVNPTQLIFTSILFNVIKCHQKHFTQKNKKLLTMIG